MGVTYDSAKDTLTFQMAGADGSAVEHVMKKGTAVISASPYGEEAAAEGDYAAEGEGEYVEDEGEYAEDAEGEFIAE
ncbi:MAG: hypothetical protein ACI4KR_08835 [Ruminiclostridium sp.]